MFGIIRPCQHRLSRGLREEWTAHLCGLCLALRGTHGQAARVATNYDGLLVSVLHDAQLPAPRPGGRRTAGPCPLRGMRTATVAEGAGAQLAAAVSLVLASAKIRDHVADGDGAFRRRPLAAAATRVAGSWDAAGARGGAGVGFDTGVLVEAVRRQQAIEERTALGSPLLAVTEPTETATSAVFAHTARLAGRPENAAPLAEAGRLFGRLAHLLDAVEDLAADRAAGLWNPIDVTATPAAEVRRLCDDAVRGVRLALDDCEFDDGRLAHALLVHELERAVDRGFGTTCSHPGGPRPQGSHAPGPHAPGPGAPGPGGGFGPPPPPTGKPPLIRGRLAGCAVWTGLFCTCQVCCRSEYREPWRGRRREGWCHKCGDCCDCCRCCDCDGCCCDCNC
ncbi:hypothetical protein SAMN06297387_103403 [Streptomyces zhaozhouensis]|uniref:Regulatory protein n=1 Tax=Streptomyces zhaozhouensis TaxID=1300267 RepID=A0A286DT37_9ACTN|nr:DUF5685 family protein [Streptomyces zhaozhouensis]SOD61795.1 hypothetical protein SAMN06297387_103403 [Streptomyces zhaozhouensis]